MKRWIVIGVLGVIVLVLFFSLGVTADELTKAQAQIPILEQKLYSTKFELSGVESKLASSRLELTNLKTENERLRAVPRYTLRDPTYKGMMDFLYADRTDLNRYVRDVYDCKHFSRDVNNAAQEKGLRSAIVSVVFPGGTGHLLVAFQTTDQGLVFIEPQSDRKMKVEKGLRYWRDNGYYSDIDDTIVYMVIVW